MSRSKNRSSLLAGNGFQTNTSKTSKEHISSMKFVMDRPKEAVFALSDDTAAKVYPDFCPWAEKDSKNSKLTAAENLNNGYFEVPSVANEYFSARNLIQGTLFSGERNGKSLLHELSSNLATAYRVRNEVINKISNASHGFKLPTRVTLTASKREMWLRDLANPEIPLSAVASKIPHGIRNKVLVDHLCTLKVPLSRALWFVKCVLCSEQQVVRKKYLQRQNLCPSQSSATQSSFPSLESIEGRWIQEWTSQVADYVLKCSREMDVVTDERKTAYQAKYSYLLRLTQTLYIEHLIDRTFFLSCVSQFLRDGLPFSTENLVDLIEVAKADPDEDSLALSRILSETPLNYGQILTALTFVQMFWTEFLESDFLCKSLGESLLLNYFLVEKIPSIPPLSKDLFSFHCALPYALKSKLLDLISSSVVNLFRHNSNAFVVPDFWLLIGGLLYRILAQSSICLDDKHRENFEAVFRLINFRNESLMLNMRYMVKDGRDKGSSQVKSSFQAVSFKQPNRNVVSSNRFNDDVLSFIELLDSMHLKTSLAASLRPVNSDSQNTQRWRTNVKILVKWCTSAYRDMGSSSQKVLTLCNYIKKKVLLPITARGSVQLKAEFEGEILESIFSLAHEPRHTLSMHNLYVLFNELLQLKVISISSYLRKIIACGIFYISSEESEADSVAEKDPQVPFHLALLSNLPALNNKQHFQILSKWTPKGEELTTSFERGLEMSKSNILQSLVADKFPENYKDFLTDIRSLSVGVKFLLATALTSQIKATITSSPKLIHMSPSTIARIYNFYEATNNLTVFFKVFIRFVLKNEDKVIIYYLDTLHFIGMLLKHNFLLVNFLPATVDRISAIYELYNLIIFSYQDLTSRETDLYDFRPLWIFMNHSIDKKTSESASASASANGASKYRRDPDLDKYLFKDSVESPLKVQVPAPRRNLTYSPDSFMESLGVLLAHAPPQASLEEVSDYCQDVTSEGFTITPEMVSNESLSMTNFEQLLKAWGERCHDSSEREDGAFSKLIRMTMKMGVEKAELLANILHVLSRGQITTFLVKLICFEIYSFTEILNSLSWLSILNIQANEISFRLIFEDHHVTKNLPSSQAVMFGLLQSEYRKDALETTFPMGLIFLKNIEDINGSEFWQLCGNAIKEVVEFALIHHKPFAIHTISAAEISNDRIKWLCYEVLHVPEPFLGSPSIALLANVANEYSLSVMQLLIRTKIALDDPSDESMGKSILQLLETCEFSIQTSNSYFGELFNYVEWEQKAKIFRFLETYFLTHKEPLEVWNNEPSSDQKERLFAFSRTNNHGVNLLPVLKDFFRGFSMSITESLDIEVEQFQHFSNFLTNILGLVNNHLVVKHHSQHLHDIISIFLRLVIIHSVSLTEVIAKHDSVHFSFLKSMMILLESFFLSTGQEKLKILLFDLLLQMKGSLTQMIVARPSEDLIETSPQALGLGTSPPKIGSGAPSPLGSHLETSAGGVSASSTISSILDLPEPELSAHDLGSSDTSCFLTLSRDELECNSEVALLRNPHLILISREGKEQFMENPFKAVDPKLTKPFKLDSVGLIEDTTPGINNGCVSLSVFGAYTTKENPY